MSLGSLVLWFWGRSWLVADMLLFFFFFNPVEDFLQMHSCGLAPEVAEQIAQCGGC